MNYFQSKHQNIGKSMILAGLLSINSLLINSIPFGEGWGGVYAQDTRYTQSYAAPLRLNPAIMGANTDIKGILNYRNQWGNISNGYTTYRFTFLYPLLMEDDQGKIDIGLSAFNDKAGAFNTLDIALALSYNLQVSESGHNLCGALTGGFVQKSLDLDAQTFDEQYVLGEFDENNPMNETINNEPVMYPDFGAGLVWYYNPSGEDSKVNAYFGASVFHHNKPDESFTNEQGNLPTRTNFHGGVKIIGIGKFDFTPNLRLSTQSGAEETAIGIYNDYNINEDMKITLGVWYRYKRQDAIAVLLGFEHTYFGLGYSYDLASFGMSKVISGAMTHEITLAFKINRAEKKGVDMNPSPFSLF
ncbi:MAG: PorP/SprF family type IX secretion system membrane protein [Bacteroidota bacterium]